MQAKLSFFLLWWRSKKMCQTTSRIWKFHGNITKNSWNYNKSMKISSNYNGNMKNSSNFDRKNVRNLVLLMFKKQGQKHMWFCCVKIQHIEFCRDTSSTGIALAFLQHVPRLDFNVIFFTSKIIWIFHTFFIEEQDFF